MCVDVPRAKVVIGGPPCQGFSLLNRYGVGLERRYALAPLPPCLARGRRRDVRYGECPSAPVLSRVPRVQDVAEREGFHVEGRVLLAADYGVPQLRRRAIAIGSRVGAPVFPTATHMRPSQATQLSGSPGEPSAGRMTQSISAPAGAQRPRTGTSLAIRLLCRRAVQDHPERGRGSIRARRTSTGHHARVLAEQEDRHYRCLRSPLVGPAGLHDPYRVLQAREGPLSRTHRAPADHPPRGRAAACPSPMTSRSRKTSR